VGRPSLQKNGTTGEGIVSQVYRVLKVRYDVLVGIDENPQAMILAFLEYGDHVVDIVVVIHTSTQSGLGHRIEAAGTT
jgi:hypothetical protein